MNHPILHYSFFTFALAAGLAFLPARVTAVPNPNTTPPGITTKQQALDAIDGFLDYIVVVSGGKSTRLGGAMTRQQVVDALSGVVSYLSSEVGAPSDDGGTGASAKLNAESAAGIARTVFKNKGLDYDEPVRIGEPPRIVIQRSPQEEWKGAVQHYKVELFFYDESVWARTSAVGVNTTPKLPQAAELAARLNMRFEWGFVGVDFNDGELYYDYRMSMHEFAALGERAPMVAMGLSYLTLQRVTPYFIRLLRGNESPNDLDRQFGEE